LLGCFRTDSVPSPAAIEICYGCTHLLNYLQLLRGCRASGFCRRSQLFGGEAKHFSRFSVDLGAFPACLFVAPRTLGGGAHGFSGLPALLRAKSVGFDSIPPLVGSCTFRGFVYASSLSAHPSKFSPFPAGLRGVAGLLADLAPRFGVTGDRERSTSLSCATESWAPPILSSD
jgi:hypothetical protein